jgi:uncharacterized protein
VSEHSSQRTGVERAGSLWTEPPGRFVRHSSMTLPDLTSVITPRRASLVLIAVLSLTVVYLVGATRSDGTSAAVSTGAVTSSTQVSTSGGVGGAGITVSGRADAAGTPDTLRLNLSVVATAPSVSEALAKANGSADAVQKSLLVNGVGKKDLQTSGLNIAPNYDYTKSGASRLKGYVVSESVSAKLRDLARAGDAIGEAVGAGGDAVRVNGISLDLEDTGVLVSQARDRAFVDAKTKAEQYAKAAGRSLGAAVSIAETVTAPSPISVPLAAMSQTKQGDVPIQPGSQEVGVTVKVVFPIS